MFITGSVRKAQKVVGNLQSSREASLMVSMRALTDVGTPVAFRVKRQCPTATVKEEQLQDADQAFVVV
jgi:hypothetical protein